MSAPVLWCAGLCPCSTDVPSPCVDTPTTHLSSCNGQPGREKANWEEGAGESGRFFAPLIPPPPQLMRRTPCGSLVNLALPQTSAHFTAAVPLETSTHCAVLWPWGMYACCRLPPCQVGTSRCIPPWCGVGRNVRLLLQGSWWPGLKPRPQPLGKPLHHPLCRPLPPRAALHPPGSPVPPLSALGSQIFMVDWKASGHVLVQLVRRWLALVQKVRWEGGSSEYAFQQGKRRTLVRMQFGWDPLQENGSLVHANGGKNNQGPVVGLCLPSSLAGSHTQSHSVPQPSSPICRESSFPLRDSPRFFLHGEQPSKDTPFDRWFTGSQPPIVGD